MMHGIRSLGRHFGITPTGIVHVGASSGQEVESYRATSARPVLLIEPLEEPFRILRDATRDDAGFHCVQACCAAQSGKVVDFHVASNEGHSSSYLMPAAHRTLHPEVRFDRTVRMTTRRLDDVVADAGLNPSDFDYLAVDTQGAELDVLRGAEAVLACVRSVFLEVSLGGIYEGDCDVHEVVEFMRSHGFDPRELMIGRHRYGDAIFLRRGTDAL